MGTAVRALAPEERSLKAKESVEEENVSQNNTIVGVGMGRTQYVENEMEQ